MTDISDDLHVEDASEDELSEFDEYLYKATAHQEFDDRLMKAVQKARDDVDTFVVDEFIAEAYVAATTLRNTLGDADGFASELANTILTNLLVVLQNVSKDPSEFVLGFLRAVKDDTTRADMASEIIHKVEIFKNSI